MIYRSLMAITGVFGLILGILVAIDGPMLLPYFGDSNLPPPTPGNMTVWSAIAFTRLFGAMLFTIGLIAWMLRNLDRPEDRRSAGLAFFLGSLFLLFFALIQQIAIWAKTPGWIAVSLIAMFPLGFGYLLFVEYGFKDYRLLSSSRDADKLRQKWIGQLREAAAQQERNRLARDLHDSIKQQIFSINVSAAAAQERWPGDSGGALRALGDVRTSAREAMSEMEAMLQQLRPAPLETIGLVEALRKQAEALQYRTGASVTTEFGELPENDALLPGTQEAIFRIAQEALSNIARHARAKNARLRLYQKCEAESPRLWLKIEDDGSGFDTTQTGTGMGLVNIKVRAAEIGGLLTIESAPGEGTNLVLGIPIISPNINKIKRICYAGSAYGFSVIFILFSKDWGSSISIYLLTLLAVSPILCFLLFGDEKVREKLRSMKNVPIKIPLELSRYIHQTWLFFWAFIFLSEDQRSNFTAFIWIGFSLRNMLQIDRIMKELKEKLSVIDYQRSIDQMMRETTITLMILILMDVILARLKHDSWHLLSILPAALYWGYVSWCRHRANSNITRAA